MGCLFSKPSSADGQQLDIPITDLVSYAFAKQRAYDPQTKLFISADDPSLNLTADETIALVKKLIAGLQAAGLKKGDAVLLHLANHVRRHHPRAPMPSLHIFSTFAV